MRRKRRTKLLETAFTLLDPQGFDAIDEFQDLPLKPQQLGPPLAKLPVVVGEFLHDGNLLRRRRDVLWPALATVTQHGAGVGFAPGAVAGGLSTTTAEGVQGAGQERLSSEESFQERRELLLEFAEFLAQGAEVVGHGVGCGKRGERLLSVYHYKYRYTEIKAFAKKIPAGAKIAKKDAEGGKEGAGTTPKDGRDRAPANRGKRDLWSPRGSRTHLAASYAAAAKTPLTSESQRYAPRTPLEPLAPELVRRTARPSC